MIGEIADQLEFEIRFYERLLKEKPDYVDALIPLAHAYTEKGDYEKGLAADLRLAALCPEDATVYYNLACSYSVLKDAGKAMQALETSFRLGYCDFKHMMEDQDLDLLKQNPEFRELVKKYFKKGS